MGDLRCSSDPRRFAREETAASSGYKGIGQYYVHFSAADDIVLFPREDGPAQGSRHRSSRPGASASLRHPTSRPVVTGAGIFLAEGAVLLDPGAFRRAAATIVGARPKDRRVTTGRTRSFDDFRIDGKTDSLVLTGRNTVPLLRRLKGGPFFVRQTASSRVFFWPGRALSAADPLVEKHGLPAPCQAGATSDG